MKKIYRVLVIDNQKEVTKRVSSIVQSTLSSNNFDVEVLALHVEIIPKSNCDFEISENTIQKLAELSTKPFNYMFSDFDFVANDSIYDTLTIDDSGEIELNSFQNKVFTLVDLANKVTEYVTTHKNKYAINLKSYFLNFTGKLSLYSFFDKRLNKIYQPLRESAYITLNVFKKADFDKLYDLREELYNNNDTYKKNENHYVFLKCKFISYQIKYIYFPGINDEKNFYSIINFFSTWKILGLFSWLHIKMILFWVVLIGLLGFLPIHLINHPRLLDGYFFVDSNYDPIMLIVTLSYLVIAAGTSLYAIDVFRQTFNTDKKIKGLACLYGFSLIFCIISVFICIVADREMAYQRNIHYIVGKTEIYTFFIFVGLFFVDLIMLFAKLKEIKYYRANSLKDELKEALSERSFILNQMFFIDIPVLIGLAFIFLYAYFADSTGFYSTSNNKFILFKTYFTVGGIGMHIIFSQFIFVMLNTKFIYNKINKKISQKSY